MRRSTWKSSTWTTPRPASCSSPSIRFQRARLTDDSALPATSRDHRNRQCHLGCNVGKSPKEGPRGKGAVGKGDAKAEAPGASGAVHRLDRVFFGEGTNPTSPPIQERGPELQGPDKLAQRIYDLYCQGAALSGWDCMRPRLSYPQQPESVKQIWRFIATELLPCTSEFLSPS